MDTFRISESHVRRQLAGFWLMMLVVLLIVGAQYWTDRSDPTISAIVAIFVLGLAGYTFWRRHKETVSFAAKHSLVLTRDSLILHDGPTERRIPYSGIELLKVHKPLFGEPWFSLKVTGLPTDRFYGYGEIQRLVSLLADKLPSDRVKGNANHA
jgi:hypothetical protein